MRSFDMGFRLRAAWLFYGTMFFFGIEQLFLNQVIKDPSARAYLIVVFTAALVLFDVPTGILADRISRKLCLLLASVFQILSLVILGFSNTVLQYMVGSFVFGVFICLINGAAHALLYDWLASQKKAKQYAREQGRNYAAFLIGAGIANVASGFIANAIGLRSTYFLSIVPAVLGLVAVLGLKDPPHIKQQAVLWHKQLKDIVYEVINHKKVLVFSIHYIAAGLVFYTIGEFGQIYMLAFGISTTMLGILWAIAALFAAGGQIVAHRIQSYPRLVILVFCLIVSVFCFVESHLGIGLFWLVYGLTEAFSNIAETEIQHETSSNVRATTLSIISLIGNMAAIPVIFLFNHLYLHQDIFTANRVVGLTVIVLLLLTLFVKPTGKLMTSQSSMSRPTKPTVI